jgi:putative ABC transport system permease protein
MVPFSDNDMLSVVKVEGRPPAPPGQDPSALWYAVSPDYFRAMAVPLVRGRLFTGRDTVGMPRVALINETMARKVFPGEDPIGRRFTLDNEPTVTREIVGIVKDVKHYGLEYQATSQLYEPYLQTPTEDMTLLLRSGTNPADLAPAAREAIHALDPDQPVSEVRTMADLVSSSTAPRRFNMLLITLFAVVALVLVAVGIYGVVAYSVAQRTREIGVRMALGARRGDVLSLVLRQGMFLVIAGVALGLAGAMALTRLIAKLLFGVGALDAVTFLSMPLVLGAVALLACYIPARRAARVDPMVALHYE